MNTNEHRRVPIGPILGSIILVGLIVLTFARYMTSHDATDVPDPATSATAEPTPQPSPSSMVATDVQPESISVSFIDRILAFEAAYSSPPSARRTAQLATFGTSKYQESHKSAPQPHEPGGDVTIRINREASISALAMSAPDPHTTTCYVSVQVTADTLRHDEAGNEIVIFHDLRFPVHNTIWIVDNGVWKVDAEQ